MTRQNKPQISHAQAHELRPRELPQVEPELAVAPPRPMVWAARRWSHGEISRQDADLLRHDLAARAWVTQVEVEHDQEGPEIWQVGKLGWRVNQWRVT